MPYRDLRCFTHGSPLERHHTRALSGSGDYKSPLYTSSSAEHEQCTWQLALSLRARVVARCGTCRLANALMPSEGGKLSTRSNGIRESIEVLYGSCNGESSGLSLLSVACVSHELHARNILDEDNYYE